MRGGDLALTRAQMEQDLNAAAEAVTRDWAYYEDRRKSGIYPAEIARRLVGRLDHVETHADFDELLQEFVAALHDGHAGVVLPGVRAGAPRESPFTLLDTRDGVVIGALEESVPAGLGVSIGDLVVAVDSRPLEGLIADEAIRTAASTSGGLRYQALRAVGRTSLGSRRLVVVKTDLRRVSAELDTLPWGARREDRGVSWRLLDDDIGYLRVPTFEAQDRATWAAESKAGRVEEREALLVSSKATMDRAFEELAGAKALILDVRGNEGGTDLLGSYLAGHLLPAGFTYFSLQTRNSEDLNRSQEWSRLYAQAKVEPPPPGWSPISPYAPETIAGVRPFSGKLIVLIDEGCFSTTDNFLAALADLHPNVRFIGRPTGGGTGAPRPLVTLPNSKAKMTFCVMRVWSPKQRLIEGTGTKPDVLVRWSRADVTERRDPDLEAALREARR